MRPPPRWLLGLLCCLPATGCCAIAQGMTALFCGAREEAWPTVSFRTPKKALLTFQEAVLRDDAEVIYRSLSEDFKEALGIRGMLEAIVAWQIIKKKIPGIYTVGRAKVVATTRPEATVVQHVLEVAFHRFRIRLKRYDYWSVVVPGPDPDQPIRHGNYVSNLSQHVQIRQGKDTSDVAGQILGVEIEDLQIEDICELTFGREWKVDLFEPVTEDKK